MRIKLFLAALLCVCGMAFSQTHSDEEYKACYGFMEKINVSAKLEKAKKQAIEAQLKNNPMMASFKSEIVAFSNKYFNYEVLKKDLAEICLQHFTAPELKQAATTEDIAAFYKTELGKKFKEKQPVIIQEGIKLAKQKFAAHQQELQAAIMMKLQQSQMK